MKADDPRYEQICVAVYCRHKGYEHGKMRTVDDGECAICGCDSFKAASLVMNEGRKDDGEKPTTDLLPFDSLLGVAEVLRYGKKKYAARNWEKGMAWGRLLGAGLRHAFAWAMG